jgi:perosamine synthetase
MNSSELERYQSAFASRVGPTHAFGFWKGRVALYAILKAFGLKEGDEVIMPGYTCVMAVNPIVYLGAKPVFADIEPFTFNIDPNRIEEKITPRTRLIIAQHTYGYPADLNAVADISSRKGIPFIEDCCLSLGTRYDGRQTGTFGLAGYFSFQWNKPYTSGLGGMAVTSDAELAGRIQDLRESTAVQPSVRDLRMLRAQLAVYRMAIYPRTTALAQNAFRALTRLGLVVGSSSNAEFSPHMAPDFFKTMSGLQARSGLRQLKRLDRNTAHRRQMAECYDQLLTESGWPIKVLPPHVEPVLVRYPVRVADKPRALATAARHFVELGSWFECPLHPEETDMSAYGYHTGMCPEADRACREVVNLPLHPRASSATARRSVEFISTIGPA